MQTGALIVAAGKSSRMGDFKPMLQLGSISIAQRVINNFRQAGISKVVVVTGYHADVLECHLASNNVVFLRNENYANTHMFVHSPDSHSNALSGASPCNSGL